MERKRRRNDLKLLTFEKAFPIYQSRARAVVECETICAF